MRAEAHVYKKRFNEITGSADRGADTGTVLVRNGRCHDGVQSVMVRAAPMRQRQCLWGIPEADSSVFLIIRSGGACHWGSSGVAQYLGKNNRKMPAGRATAGWSYNSILIVTMAALIEICHLLGLFEKVETAVMNGVR